MKQKHLQKDNFTRTPAAISHGLRRYSQYASAIPRATWHMSTAAAPSLLTPYTLLESRKGRKCKKENVKKIKEKKSNSLSSNSLSDK